MDEPNVNKIECESGPGFLRRVNKRETLSDESTPVKVSWCCPLIEFLWSLLSFSPQCQVIVELWARNCMTQGNSLARACVFEVPKAVVQLYVSQAIEVKCQSLIEQPVIPQRLVCVSGEGKCTTCIPANFSYNASISRDHQFSRSLAGVAREKRTLHANAVLSSFIST